ncbi:Actin-related protein 10 [Tupaia chinensis]|uniref:Actin-related protein 10 n=1 Tax=Tupaia chinensis TaxID=246437 RepID=L9L268_TUPCH|nr:Actin-related protein 10 [Tupaia chinensis]
MKFLVLGSVPEGILEDIKVRTCFVSDLKRGLKIQAAKFNLDGNNECPIDTRKQLAENLVVIGGTSMLPGFLHRLLAEIRYLVEKPKYKTTLGTKTFRIHTPPAKANCVAWLGGAIFGALQDILGSRSVSKEYYNQTGRIPDWCSLNNPPLEMMFDVGKAQPPLMKRAFSTEK